MEWFNVFGLCFIAAMMMPNIICAVKKKDAFENKWKNKTAQTFEQIGRFGCFAFMVFNVPKTWFGWWSDEAFAIYLIVDSVLVAAYCICWIVFWNKDGVIKSLLLSIIPSTVFLFSGIMSRSVLLVLSAILFATCHILISVKNVSLIKDARNA